MINAFSCFLVGKGIRASFGRRADGPAQDDEVIILAGRPSGEWQGASLRLALRRPYIELSK